MSDRRTRVSWSAGESRKLLEIIVDMKVIDKLDGKRQRNISVFQDIALILGTNKTAEQARSHWKCLKKGYRMAVKHNMRSNGRETPPEHFDLLDGLLGGTGLNRSADLVGVETNFSAQSSINATEDETIADEIATAVNIKEVAINNDVGFHEIVECRLLSQEEYDTMEKVVPAAGEELKLSPPSGIVASPSNVEKSRGTPPTIVQTSRLHDASSGTDSSSDAINHRSNVRKRKFAAATKQESAMERYAETQERFLLKVIKQQQTWASQEFQRQREWENTMFSNLQAMYKETVEKLLDGLLSVVRSEPSPRHTIATPPTPQQQQQPSSQQQQQQQHQQ